MGEKVLLIGIDGAPPDIIFKWAEEGLLPNIASLMARGAYGRLISTIPPMTCPAWTSSITGVDIDKHGIYDFFLHLDMRRKKLFFANSRARRIRALWNMLSRAGLSTVSLNMPVTYPPEKIKGAMISGLLTPSTKSDFTYPRSLKDELLDMGYRIDVGTPIDRMLLFREDPIKLLKEFLDLVEMRLRAALYLMEALDWDLFIAVFTAIDRVNHFFWDFLDRRHIDYKKNTGILNIIIEIYKAVDDAVGKLVEKAGPRTDIVIYSDHGFRPLNYVVFFNSLLMAYGLLSVKKSSLKPTGLSRDVYFKLLHRLPFGNRLIKLIPMSFIREVGHFLKPSADMLSLSDIEPENTLAFQLGQIIHINEEISDDEQKKEVINKVMELVNKAERLTGISGVVKEVPLPIGKRKAHIVALCPKGDASTKHFIPANGRFVQEYQRLDDASLPALIWSGDHALEGTFVMAGPSIERRGLLEGPRIIDIAPTVLELLDLEIPSYMDGRPLALKRR